MTTLGLGLRRFADLASDSIVFEIDRSEIGTSPGNPRRYDRFVDFGLGLGLGLGLVIRIETGRSAA
jgi:hypothetical protein